MPTYAWEPFLDQWSREVITADQADLKRLSSDVVTSGWLGYEGATEDQIVALEARLGTPLPPSYRHFLAITNGWRVDGFALDLVLSGVDEVDWFRTRNLTWLTQVEQSEAFMNRLIRGYRNSNDYMPDVLDAFRIAPQIGTGVQERVYLFDPREVTDGEWQAWTTNRTQTLVQQALRPEHLELYDSFWDLMQALYARFTSEAKLIMRSKTRRSTAEGVPLHYNWQPFLEQYSRDLIASGQPVDGQEWPDNILASGWLGYAGATEDQIVALESRLGTALPPSYRQFLAVTNGWRETSPFIYKLWSTEEVTWFRVRNKEWIDIWNSMDNDDDYDPDHEHREMKTALEISDVGDSAILLLNPQVISAEGEWEAWFFSNWGPGADRYGSFWDLMHAQYEIMIGLNKKEQKRLSANFDLSQLPAKLSGLIAELNENAAIWTSLAIGPGDEYNSNQAQAFTAVADKVHSLLDTPRPPSEMLTALRAIADRAEQEYVIAETSGQDQIESVLGELNQPGNNDPAQMLSRFGELLGRVNFLAASQAMAAKGRAQGLRAAAAIVRWFINDYPV